MTTKQLRGPERKVGKGEAGSKSSPSAENPGAAPDGSQACARLRTLADTSPQRLPPQQAEDPRAPGSVNGSGSRGQEQLHPVLQAPPPHLESLTVHPEPLTRTRLCISRCCAAVVPELAGDSRVSAPRFQGLET